MEITITELELEKDCDFYNPRFDSGFHKTYRCKKGTVYVETQARGSCRTRDEQVGPCSKCGGTGKIPTELGLQILEFVGKYNK